jgi:hypothetical protein
MSIPSRYNWLLLNVIKLLNNNSIQFDLLDLQRKMFIICICSAHLFDLVEYSYCAIFDDMTCDWLQIGIFNYSLLLCFGVEPANAGGDCFIIM